jgi:hypothetical protein
MRPVEKVGLVAQVERGGLEFGVLIDSKLSPEIPFQEINVGQTVIHDHAKARLQLLLNEYEVCGLRRCVDGPARDVPR